MSKNNIKIAVASGKGGTGKSCVASSLVAFSKVLAVDADVEEPNMSILLDMEMKHLKDVAVPVPVIDESLCTKCGKCIEHCRYGALTDIGHGRPFLNPKLCMHCGVCKFVCPVSAITEEPHVVGEIRKGRTGETTLIEGRLTVGMINSIPVIEEAISTAGQMSDILVIDSPPGTSCPVVATVQQADYVVLVTEPTPFGAEDLKLALEMISNLGVPSGIIINKSDIANEDIESISKNFNSPILARLPFSRLVAREYAKGISPYFVDDNWKKGSANVWKHLEKELSL